MLGQGSPYHPGLRKPVLPEASVPTGRPPPAPAVPKRGDGAGAGVGPGLPLQWGGQGQLGRAAGFLGAGTAARGEGACGDCWGTS